MKAKTKWVFDNNPNHYYEKNSTMTEYFVDWDERDGENWTNGSKFVSYESQNVILYKMDNETRVNIELNDDKVKIANGKIESLDDPNKVSSYSGKWENLINLV